MARIFSVVFTAVLSSGLPPPILVDVVCGGGLPALLKPGDGSALDCARVWESVRSDIAESQGGTVGSTLAPYTNVSFAPLGFVDSGSGIPYCRDGSLECLMYSLALCAQSMGTSPASTDTDVPSWMSLPAQLFFNLPELQYSDNIYLDFIYEHTQDTGYDWGYLTSCARSPVTLRALAAAFSRSRFLGLSPAPDGDANSTVFVAGKQVPDWTTPGAIAAAVCAAWPADVMPPPACTSSLALVRPRSADASPATGSSTVNVELFCGGSLDAVHGYCAPFIAEVHRTVLPALGNAVNFTLIPSGAVHTITNSSGGAVQVPTCAGGWAECELHGLFFCAQIYYPAQDWSELAGCLYWATGTEGGGRGNFYNGVGEQLGPVDMCANAFGDLNWGDLVTCAYGHTMTELPVARATPVFGFYVQAFSQAEARGVPFGRPMAYVGGQPSAWPSFPGNSNGTLLSEVCAALSPAPPACASG